MPDHLDPLNRLNLARLRRMVAARDSGVRLDDLADRFGLANANSAHASIWHARRMLRAHRR